jgi:hypothetical protein
MDTVFAAVNTATNDADDAAATVAEPTRVTPEAPAVNVIACVEAARFTTENRKLEPTPSSVNAAPNSAPVGVVNARPDVGVMV